MWTRAFPARLAARVSASASTLSTSERSPTSPIERSMLTEALTPGVFSSVRRMPSTVSSAYP